jgi:hypothetical protein
MQWIEAADEHIQINEYCLINDAVRFESAYNACGIPDRIARCRIQNTNETIASYVNSYFQLYDLANGIKLARVYLVDYFGTFVCLFALVTNILVIVTILNARRKHLRVDKEAKKELAHLKEAFITYMLINSILNSMYCLMYLLSYSIECGPILVDKESTKDNCLQKDIWIETLGSILKLMGNFTSIQMSMNRYLLVGKDHQKWIEKVAKMKILSMMVASLICSTLLSVVVVFQEEFFSNV